MNTTTHKPQSLSEFYKDSIESASDVLMKLNFLKERLPRDGVAIKKYPSGTPFEVIKVVHKAITPMGHLTNMKHHVFNGRKNTEFILTRDGGEDHLNFQKTYRESGGIHSPRITEIGQFQLVQVTDGNIEHGDNFVLYSISDNFLNR